MLPLSFYTIGKGHDGKKKKNMLKHPNFPEREKMSSSLLCSLAVIWSGVRRVQFFREAFLQCTRACVPMCICVWVDEERVGKVEQE